MFYVFLILLVLFVLWGLMLYVRKSHWDIVHRNLLDLEDHYEGKVIRRGFAARPFFHGRVEGHPFTLNISTERLGEKRMNYIDISWGLPTKEAFTISEYEWLKKQRGNDKKTDLLLMKIASGKEFAFIHKNKEKLKKIMDNPAVREFISQFEDLCYVFLSKNGILCEFSSDNLAQATEFSLLNRRLHLLKNLGEVFQK